MAMNKGIAIEYIYTFAMRLQILWKDLNSSFCNGLPWVI
jgi:hypothetical protein